MKRIFLSVTLLSACLGVPAQAAQMTPEHMLQTNLASDAALAKLSGKAFDRAFLSMMIPHHQAAVRMSQAVLPRSKDATVQRWAKSIIADQEKEIGEMQAWLKALGGVNTQMASMMMGMQGMASMVKDASDPDLAYVQGMVGHHAGAVGMANLALQKSNDPRILLLARDIVRSQAQEIYDFRGWLAKH